MAVLKGYIKSINYGLIESALFGIVENHAREYGARIKEKTQYMHGAFNEASCDVLGFNSAKDAFDCQKDILAEISKDPTFKGFVVAGLLNDSRHKSIIKSTLQFYVTVMESGVAMMRDYDPKLILEL